MASTTQRIMPCLWFDQEAEEAVNFYVGIFRNSRITATSRYGEAGKEVTGGTPGSVMVVAFELDGQSFTALNGGPHFKFNEAVSLQVNCETQEEIDYYWERLTEGGEEGQCGWLKDRYGLSWQVVPAGMAELFADHDPERARRATEAMLGMRKLDIAAMRRAAEGVTPA